MHLLYIQYLINPQNIINMFKLNIHVPLKNLIRNNWLLYLPIGSWYSIIHEDVLLGLYEH